MILRDTVLGLVGQMEKLNSRLQKIETKETVFPSDPTNNDKFTQTESDCTSYPPASDEALALWTSYKISQKTATELLLDALKSLDLKNVIENQNRQISKQTNMLNNINRNLANFSPKPGHSGAPKRSENSETRNKSRNGPTGKKKRDQ